jgi:hypothetical protein
MAQAMNDLAAEYKCELTPAEERFYDAMRELNEMALIGVGIGGRFVNTEELHVMNYNEAIKSEKDKWDYAVKEEHDRMTSNKVWEAVPIDKSSTCKCHKDLNNSTQKIWHYYCYEQFMDWFKQHWLFGERQLLHSHT